jgi:hypothetical protein
MIVYIVQLDSQQHLLQIQSHYFIQEGYLLAVLPSNKSSYLNFLAQTVKNTVNHSWVTQTAQKIPLLFSSIVASIIVVAIA